MSPMMMPSQAKSYLPLSTSTVVTGSRCHATPARRQNVNTDGTAPAVRPSEPFSRWRQEHERLKKPEVAFVEPTNHARSQVQEFAKAVYKRRTIRTSGTAEKPPRQDRAKVLNTAAQRPPWAPPSPVYNRWARWKRPQAEPECAGPCALGLGGQEKPLQESSQRRGASKQVEELHAALLSRHAEHTGAEGKRGLYRGISSQRRDASTPVLEKGTAGLTDEEWRAERLHRWISSQRRDACIPVVEQVAVGQPVDGREGRNRGVSGQRRDACEPVMEQGAADLTVDGMVHKRKREGSPLGAQRATRLPRPRLKITRNWLKPRTYRTYPSILKKAGAPKKHKSVRFAESVQVHTIDWTAEHADDGVKHLLDEHALRPVSWTTGSLNTPMLRDPNGTHAETWKTVQSGDEVITGFRTPQQRARVGQVQAFYRAQARDALATVTDPDIVEVKQLIPGFYGRKSRRATPMWRGVMIDKYDAVEDALPTFAFGEASVGPFGGWHFRSEAFQCHRHTTDWEPELFGRYQCEKGGNCVRFSHARPCGCEGKWFKYFGPTTDLKIFDLVYTPSFMPASTARLQQWTAVTRGGNGLTIASQETSVTAGTILTQPDVAEPHPRPFVTARRQPSYPRSARYKAKERVREWSRSPIVETTEDTTKYVRPIFKDPTSFDPGLVQHVMTQMLEKNPWMASDSKFQSILASVLASRA
ncbi:hypothetical protein T440DRAFT_559171 [Plenodomus tracheiphilus IPT5]|uniref:Uncharacterized protein n=1 Tax=Plenodomus tracheiphilus IPT5 TaxID=1408161 RepID=A0A6A7APF4_9PLEO|nr:hypothetical protein T440DRAFT_559171 [Plenodomus tracheiphilus IPT5]